MKHTLAMGAINKNYWTTLDLPAWIYFTGAQLRHNDFRIFADPSRIFTYNCAETFKTTSRNLSENMPGHA